MAYARQTVRRRTITRTKTKVKSNSARRKNYATKRRGTKKA